MVAVDVADDAICIGAIGCDTSRTTEPFILQCNVHITKVMFGLSIFSDAFWNLVSLIYLQHNVLRHLVFLSTLY